MNSDIFNPNFNINDARNLKITGFRDIRAVTDRGSKEKIVGVHWLGNKLKSEGILRGDWLIVRLESDISKVSKYALCVCKTANGGQDVFRKSEIFDEKLVGVVVRVERDLM